MRSLPPKTLRSLRNVVDWARAHGATAWKLDELERDIDRALGTKRSVKLARSRAKASKAEEREEWQSIRVKVLERAESRCEHCGKACFALEADHVFGRGGGRKTLQSVYTCWALCHSCHRLKTRNEPSAIQWLKAFYDHCNTWAARTDNEGYRVAAVLALKRIDWLETRAAQTAALKGG